MTTQHTPTPCSRRGSFDPVTRTDAVRELRYEAALTRRTAIMKRTFTQAADMLESDGERIAELVAALRDVLAMLSDDMTNGDFTRCIRSPNPAIDGPRLNAARAALAKAGAK